MKYGNLLFLGVIYTATSAVYAIPKPPEMHPKASPAEVLNARMEIISRDGLALEVTLKGEVKLGDDECQAANNEGFLALSSRDVDPIMVFEATVIETFEGKGKCKDGRLNPIFKTIEKTLWIEEETQKILIKNPVHEDKPSEFFLRGEVEKVRNIDIQFVKTLESSKSVYNVSGEIFVGAHPCLSQGREPFFTVSPLISGQLQVVPHASSRVTKDVQCVALYSPQWAWASVDVEADSAQDITVVNISFGDWAEHQL